MSILVLLALAGADPSTSAAVLPVSSVATPIRSSPAAERSVQHQETIESDNFIVRSHACGPNVNEFSRCCERVRIELHKQFLEKGEVTEWSPKCEVVLHQSRAEYLNAVGRAGAQTSGSSAIGLKSNLVVKRRIDLLADATNRPSTTVRHELVHVILADLFPDKAPPKWAEEGLALLNDSDDKQDRHRVDLHHAIQTRTLIPLHSLLSSAEYPANCQRATFYAQSMTIAECLLDRGTPKQFIEFVRLSMASDCDRALRSTYQIDGITGLSQQLQATLKSTSIIAASTNKRGEYTADEG